MLIGFSKQIESGLWKFDLDQQYVLLVEHLFDQPSGWQSTS